MTATTIPHDRAGTVAPPLPGARTLQYALLVAGALSSLLYITADLVAVLRYPGYSILDQTISELSAIGAPTGELWSTFGTAYGILFIAFTVAVFRESPNNAPLRLAAIVLLTFVLSGLLWTLFPMHQRGAPRNWQDAGHLILGGVSALLFICLTGFGAMALGKRFRAYSFATMIVVILTAVPVFMWAERVAANQPTPWLGLVERIMMYAYLLWIAVMSSALTRRRYRQERSTFRMEGQS